MKWAFNKLSFSSLISEHFSMMTCSIVLLSQIAFKSAMLVSKWNCSSYFKGTSCFDHDPCFVDVADIRVAPSATCGVGMSLLPLWYVWFTSSLGVLSIVGLLDEPLFTCLDGVDGVLGLVDWPVEDNHIFDWMNVSQVMLFWASWCNIIILMRAWWKRIFLWSLCLCCTFSSILSKLL